VRIHLKASKIQLIHDAKQIMHSLHRIDIVQHCCSLLINAPPSNDIGPELELMEQDRIKSGIIGPVESCTETKARKLGSQNSNPFILRYKVDHDNIPLLIAIADCHCQLPLPLSSLPSSIIVKGPYLAG
jgi:hypothetical protein